ncbi:MAG TPA: TRAP transporter small permease [Bacillota bacterium]
MQSLARALERVTQAGLWVSATAILAMTVLVTLATLGRWLIGETILGADELSGYLLVTSVYMGLAYTVTSGGFIRVEVVYERLRGRSRHWANVLGHLLSTLYGGVLCVYFWQLALSSWQRGVRSIGVLEFPLYIPQAVMALGISLLTVQLLASTLQLLFTASADPRRATSERGRTA